MYYHLAKGSKPANFRAPRTGPLLTLLMPTTFRTRRLRTPLCSTTTSNNCAITTPCVLINPGNPRCHDYSSSSRDFQGDWRAANPNNIVDPPSHNCRGPYSFNGTFAQPLLITNTQQQPLPQQLERLTYVFGAVFPSEGEAQQLLVAIRLNGALIIETLIDSGS